MKYRLTAVWVYSVCLDFAIPYRLIFSISRCIYSSK
jgi:hypothetical protein